MRALPLTISLAILAILLPTVSLRAQLTGTFSNWIAHPAIAYQTKPATDPVARLNLRLREGSATLAFDERSGYLRSTLAALDIPVESQVALFNRDSLQTQIISSVNPRALYFNDSVSVGFVPGGFLELAAQDPVQGIVFYALDNEPGERPQFRRRFDCLTCHYSASTAYVPGMLDRSTGQLAVNHAMPLGERWGGWYVTGESRLAHQGNRVPLPDGRQVVTSPTWPSLDVKLDAHGYLSDRSDIAALLVFNHQMTAMNLLARVGWEARVAEYERAQAGDPLLTRLPGGPRETPMPLVDAARELVDYFLFVDEAPLPAPVRGTAGFAERFAAIGPRDRQGRSLRQLDLESRLLRYPCSYLIYSDAFDALPAAAREAIYRRLWDVLSGTEQNERYRRLSADTRQAIVEILRETKPESRRFFAAS